MKILLISARADHGGGPHSTFRLAREFSNRGHSVFVALPNDKPYFDLICNELGASSIVNIPHRRVSLTAICRVVYFIRLNGIQLLHSNGKGAGVYAKIISMLCGIPFVHTPRGIHVFEYSTLRMWLYRKYENSLNRFCKAVVFVSLSEKMRAEELRLWDAIPNIVINNGISLQRTRASVRESTIANFPFAEHDFVVASITRFDVSKNMSEALQIAKLCPDIKFLWIGDGPDRKVIELEASKSGVKNIIFFGESADPVNLLAFCDCYLSTSRWEGLPNALLEAGLMSLPCVVSKVTGNVDVIIDGDNGFLYELGDAPSAAIRLHQLEQDRFYNLSLGSNARKRIENYFSDSQMFDKYQVLFYSSIACIG